MHSRRGLTESLSTYNTTVFKIEKKRKNEDRRIIKIPAQQSKPSFTPLKKAWCTFQILGGCQGRRTGVGVTTVSNSLILGGWVTKVLKNGDKK